MRYLFLIIFTVFVVGNNFGHPLHFSVTNIDVKDNQLNIAIKVFHDDFTLAIKNRFNLKTIHLDDTSLNTQNLIEEFINDQLHIETSGEKIRLSKMRYHSEEISFWIYFTSTLYEAPQQLTIKNSILSDYFNDQKNLVIINAKNMEKGLTFDNTVLKKTVFLNETQNN